MACGWINPTGDRGLLSADNTTEVGNLCVIGHLQVPRHFIHPSRLPKFAPAFGRSSVTGKGERRSIYQAQKPRCRRLFEPYSRRGDDVPRLLRTTWILVPQGAASKSEKSLRHLASKPSQLYIARS